MKRHLIIAAVLLATLFSFTNTYANNDKQELQSKVSTMTEEQKTARMNQIKARVEEIQYMDKSNLSSDDKKALRQELRSMNKEAKAISHGGIYISFGALIVIIVLLIIIL